MRKRTEPGAVLPAYVTWGCAGRRRMRGACSLTATVPSQPTEGYHSHHLTSLITAAQWGTSWGWENSRDPEREEQSTRETEARKKSNCLPKARGQRESQRGEMDGPMGPSLPPPEPVLQLPGGAHKPGLCKDFSAIKFLFEMKPYAVGEAFYARH